MDYNLFLKQLNEGFKQNVIVICGNEEFLTQKAIIDISNKYSGNFNELNMTIFSDNTSADTILSTCEQLPFMADKRLVIVKNPPELKKVQKGTDRYIDYIENSSDQTLLVFWLNEKIDMRTQIAKVLQKKNTIMEFETPDTATLIKWIIKHFSIQNKKIDSQTAEYLLFRVGNNMLNLANEIKKLVALAGDKDVITKELIDLIIVPNAQESIFKLIDMLLEMNTDNLLRYLNNLIYEGEKPAGIISLLLSTFHNILQIKIMQVSSDKGILKVNLPDFVIKKYQKLLKNISLKTIKTCFNILLDAEDNLKSGQLQPDTALYNSLTKIIIELKK